MSLMTIDKLIDLCATLKEYGIDVDYCGVEGESAVVGILPNQRAKIPLRWLKQLPEEEIVRYILQQLIN